MTAAASDPLSLLFDQEAFDRLAPAKQAEVLERMALLRQSFKDNPLWNFVPHPKQAIFLESSAFQKLFIGGNRSGKTTCGIVDDIIQAVDRDAVPPWLQASKQARWDKRFHCRIIVPDFQQTLEGVVLQKIRDWCPVKQLAGGSFDSAYDKLRHMLWFENGNWFQFMTFEQALDKFQGAALDRVHYDEEPPERIRNENRWRLIDRNGQEMYTMTPLNGMSYTYETFFEPWEKLQDEAAEPQHTVSIDGLGPTTVVTVDIEDNPHLDEDARARIADDPNLSEEERKSRKSGRFISFSGLIYGNSFDRHHHVVPDPGPPEEGGTGIPAGADVYEGIDPGLRHMAAYVAMWVEPWEEILEGPFKGEQYARAVIFDELAMQNTTIDLQAEQIKLLRAKWGFRPRWTVIDPASRNRNAQTGKSDAELYAEHGIVTFPGQNAVGTGIQRVKVQLEASLQPNVLRPGIHLYVSGRCVTFLDQMKKYRWAKVNRSGENDSKEAPVKKDDHLLDAGRYLVMSRPIPPDPIVNARPLTPLEEAILRDMQGGERETHEYGPGMLL